MAEPSSGALRPEGSPKRGDTLGRFVVVGLVGRGGMGEVYSAYDPELDRKVAVKVLRARGDSSADARLRLLREAQATARLSHPNVVIVYDVGTVGDSVFIAMEFVDGNTVGYWMNAARRSAREILDIFVAAGRGLSAAHDAGLVHRDFKPDNVMVGRDGQVRVMDFGLARTVGEADGAAPAPDAQAPAVPPPDGDLMATKELGAAAATASSSSGKYLQVKLTQTGAQMGTPAYMAPEQFLGGATDARTDQFSFCVALYEALYGERPFAGDSFGELMGNVLMETVRAPSASSHVPAWLRKVVLRGLHLSPDARWPSMMALIAALQADPAIKRRKWLVGALVPVLVIAGAAVATRVSRQHVAACAGGPARLANVWDAGGSSKAKAAIHQAFLGTGKSYAEQAFLGAARLLDAYAVRWLAAYQDSCEATHVRGEQSPEVLDLRMVCLQERVTSLRALTEVLAHADSTVVENAVGAASALPQVETCADIKSLRAVVPPPADPARSKQVDALRVELAGLIAERDAGHCQAAQAKSVDLLKRVRAVEHLPLLADTLNAVGVMANDCADPGEAVKELKEAYLAATASRHDQAAAEASANVPTIAVNRVGDIETAREWLAIGQAALRRIGTNPRIEAWLLTAESSVHSAEHDHERAISSERRSLILRERLNGPDHLDTIISLADLGLRLQDAAHLEEARDVDVQARQRTERVLGPDHPMRAMIGNNEGEVLNQLGRFAEAEAAFARAVEIWRKAGTPPQIVAYGLTGLGIARIGQRHGASAVEILREAVKSRVESHADAFHVAEARFALARALHERAGAGREARSTAVAARAELGSASAALAKEIDAWLSAN